MTNKDIKVNLTVNYRYVIITIKAAEIIIMLLNVILVLFVYG